MIPEGLQKEVYYRTSRSSGAGGQHVNKVSTKVDLIFNVERSAVLSDGQKAILNKKLRNRISNEGLLLIQCDETRSQLKNKAIAYARFIALIEDALKPVKKRKPTKPSKSSVEKRLKLKKQKSEKKTERKQKDDH